MYFDMKLTSDFDSDSFKKGFNADKSSCSLHGTGLWSFAVSMNTCEDWGCYSYVYLWVMLFPFGESYDLKKKKSYSSITEASLYAF